MLLDSSTSFYKYYQFTFYSFDVIRGQTWIYAKGTIPPGTGIPFVAFRMKSSALVALGNGPGIYESATYDLSPFATALGAERTLGASRSATDSRSLALREQIDAARDEWAAANTGASQDDVAAREALALERLLGDRIAAERQATSRQGR